jgi:2'-5' RNA ligase
MRAFFAIELPYKVREDIYSNIEELKKLKLSCKYVEMENLHITLLFLGEIENKVLDERIELLEEDLSKMENFDISIEDIGFFYNRRGLVRVIWHDIIKNSKSVEEICKIIYAYFEDVLEKNGLLGKHDIFKSHLTIGRAKKINRYQNEILKEWGMRYNSSFKKTEFNVGKISVIKSELTPEGPKYIVLKEIGLK